MLLMADSIFPPTHHVQSTRKVVGYMIRPILVRRKILSAKAAMKCSMSYLERQWLAPDIFQLGQTSWLLFRADSMHLGNVLQELVFSMERSLRQRLLLTG
jgi:hypothetical protein